MRRQKADPRDAHMARYEQFAWQDALALAAWLKQSFDLVQVKETFDALTVEELHTFETESEGFIRELLAKPVSQRPAYLRKVGKNVSEMTQAILIVLAIIAQVRVMEVIEIRDRFRYSLYPGGANRATCASIYAFNNEMRDVTFMNWPTRVFDALAEQDAEQQDFLARHREIFEQWEAADRPRPTEAD
ncbi:hypothetical protein [Pseudomonas sp. EMN2]|uniref:hypothetical protein n=1 Tax=Pseudomonas sp. EMN2 TaxID=2615212 RepID=UPI0015B481BD|nr:hypothetical protein [Pseudomonas sp. EMN2]